MRTSRRAPGRCRPILDQLERREVMTAGVSASLSHGVLYVGGTRPSTPIVVDVIAVVSHRKLTAAVMVEGVGVFRAVNVKRVTISSVVGEPVVVNRSKWWNPAIVVNPPSAPITLLSTPPPRSTIPPVVSFWTTPPVVTTTPTPPVAETTESATELQIVAAVNIVRQMNGLSPLTLNTQLVEMGHIQAGQMVQFHDMSHDLPGAAYPTLLDRANHVGYRFYNLGENIAYNFPDVGSVMAAWMNSPGHRANILNPNYTQIGIGVAVDSGGGIYYSQEFGQPML